MSELIQKHDNRVTIRWKLLTGASALALTAYIPPLHMPQTVLSHSSGLNWAGSLSIYAPDRSRHPPCVLGNAGTIMSFHAGPEDAAILAKEFQLRFEVGSALFNLPNHSHVSEARDRRGAEPGV